MRATTIARAAAEAAEPIRIDCPLEGLKDNFVLYKRQGWKFRHRRLAEQELGAEDMAALMLERMAGWSLEDEAGQAIPFPGFQDPEASEREAIERAAGNGQAAEQAKLAGTLARNAARRANAEAFDELGPMLALWVMGSFVQAYQVAASPLLRT